jgi:hypothetical protein
VRRIHFWTSTTTTTSNKLTHELALIMDRHWKSQTGFGCFFALGATHLQACAQLVQDRLTHHRIHPAKETI